MGYQALLFCSDEKLARVVSQVFSELDFVVDPVTEPFAAVKKLMAQHYDAIVVDCDNEQNSALLFKSARNSSSNQGSLAIALVEGQAGVAKAYRIGANLVLTKPINVEQAKGTLRVARGLLRKSSDATPAASQAAAAAAATAGPAAPSIQPPNRIVEAIAPPPTRGQSPEFEASFSHTASSAGIEAKPAPAKDWSSLVAQKTIAPVSLSSSKAATEEIKITEAPKPCVVPVLNTSSRSQGTASATAPAKEVIAPAKKQAEKKTGEEITKIEATARPQPSFSTTAGSMSEGPSFTFLDDDTDGSGSSKKILITAVAALVLAGAGYFGWTKFSHAHPGTQLVTTTQPQRPTEPVPDSSSVATSAPAPLAGATGRQGAATTSPAPKTSSATSPAASSVQPDQPSTGSSSMTRIALRPETEAKESASAPLLVKSAAKSVQTQTEESSAQLPSPLAVASGDSGLSGILSSASSDLPKPTLTQIKISQGVSQGLVIKRVQPKYPASALATHLEGAVQIEATINKEGTVINPKVLSGDRMLAAAALEAVRQWRYKPYYLDGGPVEIQTQITVNFKAR
jgi:periplasmic protein TonB